MALYFTEDTDHLIGGECSDHSCFRTLHLGRDFFFNWNWTLQKYCRIQSSLSTLPTVFSLSRAGQDTKSTASKLLLDSLLLLRNHRYSLMVWRTSGEKHISIMKQQTFPLVLISHFIFPEVGQKMDYMMNLVYMETRMSQYIHVSLLCHKEICSDTQWLYFHLKSLSVFPRNQIPTPVCEGVCLSHRWSRMTQLKASCLPQPPKRGSLILTLACVHACTQICVLSCVTAGSFCASSRLLPSVHAPPISCASV